MSTPYYERHGVTVHAGDCLDVLAAMADGSIDAIVCDPPYGLEFMSKPWDSFKPSAARIRTRVDGRTNPKVGKSTTVTPEAYVAGHPFQRWCEAWASECLRVLKPGGHLVAFGGTRTYHRLTSGIEDAGFEIRDGMSWVYGSGFPKSLDVGKAIDKRGGTDGGWFADWLAESRTAAGLTRDEVSAHFPSKSGGKTGKVWNWEHGHGVCTQPEFDQLCGLFGQPRRDVFEAEGEFVAARRGTHGRFGPGDTRANAPRLPVLMPATDEAARWQGWGTALKPAFEPIVVARKPLSGTVAATVLAHGTGALNIDACRTGADERTNNAGGSSSLQRVSRVKHGYRDHVTTSVGESSTVSGRWPTNVLLTHAARCDDEGCDPSWCPVAELDVQSGTLTSGYMRPEVDRATRQGAAFGEFSARTATETYADSGGASRFFPTFRWEAKAPTAERPQVNGVSHPTVKPLDLMRWLVRLVTPPGGIVLDPFAGSGTTLHAARAEGFRAIGIEREPSYLPLIKARLDARARQATVTPPIPDGEQMDLLDLLGDAS